MLRPLNRVSSAANSIGILAFVLGLAACGARSALWLGDARSTGGTGGSGGATIGTGGSTSVTTSSTSSTGGTGGTGGGSPVCGPLVEVVLPAVDGFHARRPALVPLAGSASMAAVIGLDAVVASEPPEVPIADVAFDAWGAWPPPLAAPHVVAPDGGGSFAVAPRGGPTFALLAALGDAEIDEAVDPMGSAALMPVMGMNQAEAVGFLAVNGVRQAIGIQRSLSPNQEGLSFVVVPQSNDWTEFGITCSSDALVGDAMALGNEFLVAAATSVPVTSCGFSFVGPPRDVRLFLHQGPHWKPVDDILQSGALVRLRLSPRSDGAWLLTQVASPDGALQAVRAYRISTEAHPLDQGADIVSAGRSGFAVAPRGDGFTLAWIEDPGPGGAALGVATFDATGMQTTTQIYPLAPGATVTDPVVIQASPDGAMLLLAWSQATPGDADSVHVVRFGCSN